MTIIVKKSRNRVAVGFRLDAKTVKTVHTIAEESGNSRQDVYEALIKAGLEKFEEE
jgi:predicted transcriptional regulator